MGFWFCFWWEEEEKGGSGFGAKTGSGRRREIRTRRAHCVRCFACSVIRAWNSEDVSSVRCDQVARWRLWVAWGPSVVTISQQL